MTMGMIVIGMTMIMLALEMVTIVVVVTLVRTVTPTTIHSAPCMGGQHFYHLAMLYR